MKATTSNQQELTLELKEMSKVELVIVKAGITLFTVVLSICTLQLIF